ncbi:Hypothetical protein A7982_08523 [Minicystis rosea]|nr:Hypothetical protein A7982_08523 [Minicystis rosea]
MSDLRFDPSKAVTFDLAQGHVHLEGAPSRLLVPADALGLLVEAAGAEAAAAFGRSLGTSMGRRIASRLSAAEGVGAAAVDLVVEHLGGELALAGLGALGLERWGRAIVLVVDHCPLGATGDALLEAALGSALASAAGRSATVVRLDRDGVRARFFVGGEPGAAKVKAWLSQGISWGDALVRLHAPSASPAAAIRAEEGEA